MTLGRWDTINLKVGGKTVIEVTDEGPWAGIHAAVVSARGGNLWLNALRQQALWSTVDCSQLVIKGANKEILVHCGMIRAMARQHADWPSIQGGVHDTIRALSAGGKGRAGRSGEPQPWAIEELQRLADRELPMPAWWG